MSFNVQGNPFLQQSYLFNLQVQPGAQQPGAQQPGGNSSGAGSNQQQQQTGATLEPTAMQDFINDLQRKKAMRQRKNQTTQQQDGTMQKLLSMLDRNQLEVRGLEQQLSSSKDPTKRQRLQTNLDDKNTGLHTLGLEVNSSYSGPGGGFVGNENRLDWVGSFVTYA